MISGRLIGIKVGSTFIPCETGCSFDAGSERLPTSNSTNGNFKTSIAGYRSWSVGVNGNLVINSSESGAMKLLDALKNGTNVTLTMTFIQTSTTVFTITGTASPINISINVPSVGVVTWSGTFEGNGAFTTTYP